MSTINHEHPAIETYQRRISSSGDPTARYALGALLAATAREAGLTVEIGAELLHKGQRYDLDGAIRDGWGLPIGAWRALPADTAVPLNIATTYPLDNFLIANLKTATLIQNGREVARVDDMSSRKAIADLLTRFFGYEVAAFSAFATTAKELEAKIDETGRTVNRAIKRAHGENPKFIGMYEVFLEVCRAALNPNIRQDAVDEMLVQHVLAIPLLESAFQVEGFTRRNIIASEIERVIAALEDADFSRKSTLAPLQPLYDAARAATAELQVFHDYETFVTTVYERRFRGFSVSIVDSRDERHTPQVVANFMNALVLEVLEQEFDKSLASEDVVILDPAAGTGNLIAGLLRHAPATAVESLYAERLFANEVLLLPYYTAALYIEHIHRKRAETGAPFAGLSFVDTLTLTDKAAEGFIADENAERIERQKQAAVNVIVSDPPYDLRQLAENDTTRSRHYPDVEKRLKATYVNGDITGAARSAPDDAYVKFLRWATDRIGERDGVVCLFTDNRFTDQDTFDGVRKRLLEDFTRLYHVDLRGSTTQAMRGVEREVGITLAIRSKKHKDRKLYYFSVPESWHRIDILQWLGEMAPNPGTASAETRLLPNVKWHILLPDDRHTWLMRRSAASSKDTRLAQGMDAHRIFKEWSGGVQTKEEAVATNFDRNKLAAYLNQYQGLVFDPAKIRVVQHRPFTRKFIYTDDRFVPQKGIFPRAFPNEAAESENRVLWVRVAPEASVFALMTRHMAAHLPDQGTQCFPFYIYDTDGSNRRDNIADWVLTRFRDHYSDPAISKWDIFHYIYALLHHAAYRMRCANTTRHDLPRIPFVTGVKAFHSFAEAGIKLAELHLDYETTRKSALHWAHDGFTTVSFRVEKMTLNPDKRTIRVNDAFTLEGVPEDAFGYRIGNLSALEWLINQYQITTDTQSGLVSNPNQYKGERYVISLVERVVYLSVETVRVMRELSATPLRSVEAMLSSLDGGA